MEDKITSITIDPVEEPVAATPLSKPFKTNFARKFCSTTSLHGFQYIGDKTRPSLERLCWIVAVCLSVATCTSFIYRAYSKWVTVPIYVTFAEKSTSINEITFPAVTICPGNKIRKPVIDMKGIIKKLDSMEELDSDEMEKFSYRELLCRRISIYDEEEFPQFETEKALDFIEEAGYNLSRLVLRCTWRNVEKLCDQLFTSVLTDEGLCYTFNMVNAEELLKSHVDREQFTKHLAHDRNSTGWTLEGGYKSDEVDFPLRTSSSGSMEGLSFFYTEYEEDLMDACGVPTFGLQVLVHSPVDFPQVSTQFFLIPPGHEVVVGLQANMITTSVTLQEGMTPYQRRCFMSHERQLLYFTVYTEANCEFECFINATLASCNCSAYYMPRPPNTPICGAGSNMCLNRVLANIHRHVTEDRSACKCLPSCTEVHYNAEISETKISWADSVFSEEIELQRKEMGRISIYFKRNRFIPSRRSELYGSTEFIANCGGLLGLFLGFSFLSLVEVFYFLLMRPLLAVTCSWYKRLRQTKKLR